jgi:hypothetical protein
VWKVRAASQISVGRELQECWVGVVDVGGIHQADEKVDVGNTKGSFVFREFVDQVAGE